MPGENHISDNEVQIGKNKIGPNTIIQINLKTLVVSLSFLVSVLGYFWMDISKKVEKSNGDSVEKINRLQEEIKAIKYEELNKISSQLNQVDGKVQGIFINMQRDVYTPSSSSNTQRVPELNSIRPQNPK